MADLVEGPRGKKKTKQNKTKTKNQESQKDEKPAGQAQKTTPPFSSRFGPATEDFLGLEVIRISQF